MFISFFTFGPVILWSYCRTCISPNVVKFIKHGKS